MKKLYREGKIGEFEYGECEYVHNCEPFWHSVTYGEKDHWRNRMYSTFYCTHSIGPLIHATGLRPVRVSGFEGAKNERCLRVGRKSGSFGMEIITLDNGATIKSIHGSLYKNSMYGSKGRMETARESAHCDEWDRLYVQADDFSGAYGSEKYENYVPEMPKLNGADNFGHGGSDFYSMYNFVEKILGDKNADVIDVYEACPDCLLFVLSLTEARPWIFPIFAIKKSAKSGETTRHAPIRKWRAICFCLRNSAEHRI